MIQTGFIKKTKLLALLTATLGCLYAVPLGVCAQDSCATIDPPLPGTDPCDAYNTYVMITFCYVCEYYGGDEDACDAATEKLSMMGLAPACAACGDGFCDVGEDCPQDCFTACGDGVCRYPEALVCGPESPPECLECPGDCGTACGNGMCEGPETPDTCPQDCTHNASCGNDRCDRDENAVTCPADCTVCGDGVCSPWYEDEDSCPADCG